MIYDHEVTNISMTVPCTHQLSDLQEELNKRESRWQANSARLRTRVEILEKDNKELEDDLEGLRQEKHKLAKKEESKVRSTQGGS